LIMVFFLHAVFWCRCESTVTPQVHRLSRDHTESTIATLPKLQLARAFSPVDRLTEPTARAVRCHCGSDVVSLDTPSRAARWKLATPSSVASSSARR
jgi:hypothetical protein